MGDFHACVQDTAIAHGMFRGVLSQCKAQIRRINKGDSFNSIIYTIHLTSATHSQSSALYIRIVSVIVNSVNRAQMADSPISSGRPRRPLISGGRKISPIDCRCAETWF
jgi:hypothetical protein